MTADADEPAARAGFEAAVWQAFRGLRAPPGSRGRGARVDDIMTAADAYAAGDSDGVTEMRRHVLDAMSSPIPEGTRR